MKFNEQYTVEKHIIKFLREKLGFEYIPPESFEKLRQYEHEYIIEPLLRNAVEQLNPGASEADILNVTRQVKAVERNRDFLEVLRNGVDLVDPQTRKMRTFKIVDYSVPAHNHFVVTNQFYFAGNAENIRPDVMVFINGIPAVLIEAKSPTAGVEVSFENGIDQIKRYEKYAKNIFIPNCFNIATDGLKTVYGPTYAPKHFFTEWRDEALEKELGGNLEMTLASLLAPARLTDIIQNFLVFEDSTDGAVKKMARYQQLRAANKIFERFKDNDKKRALVWHTQGSGKSLTMFFAAWKLRYGAYEKSELRNPKVLVLVDRVDLDDQIYETFINCGGKNVERVESREALLKAVNAPDAAIFISTIQKFDENVRDVKNTAHNIVILIDEAHRTQYGEMGVYLRDAVPNATLIGFTGTPIAKTHEEFGLLTRGNPERYLDYYSIQQAIADNATVPITYEARLSKFEVDEKKIDEQFDLATADLSAEEKQVLIAKYGRKDAFIKLEKRMQAVAQDIYDHYRLYVAPDGFKAQVVCYDREAVASYKKIFDEIMPKEYSEVVYSEGKQNEIDDDLRSHVKTKKEIKEVIERFKNPESPLKFLIVCDMLLTGFDAPVEQVMYLDKPLWGHNLLQAIARTNRSAPHKGYGKVIDYYGITRKLREALQFDEKEIADALVDIGEVRQKFEAAYRKLLQMFEGVNTEDPTMENLRKCLKLFEGNKDQQREFEKILREMLILFEVISPDNFLAPYLRKVEWLSCFYVAYQKEYNAALLKTDVYALVGEYGAKLKAIVQAHVDYEGITKNYRELRIDQVAELEKRYGEDEEAKVKNLETLLKSEISANLDTSPIFKKFSERLQAIQKEFEEHQTALAERLKAYRELLAEIESVRAAAGKMGLNIREFALYSFSEEFVKEVVRGALKEYVQELAGYLNDLLQLGWQDSIKREDYIKDIKREVQRMLLQDYKSKLEVAEFQKYLNRLVDIVIKKFE